MIKNFAIIGTGITGTAMLIALTRNLSAYKKNNGRLPQIKIITVDKRQLNGGGYPYDPDGSHSAHLLNHPATEMALKPVDEAGRDKLADFEVAGWHSYDFVRWLEAHKDKLAKEYPESIHATHTDVDLNAWAPRPDGHYSRGLFGLYAQDRFYEAVADLKHLGVEVVLYNEIQATTVRRHGTRLTLTLKNLQTDLVTTLTMDKILLATGRWSKQISNELKTLRYFEKPYPALSLLDTIKPSVLINKRPKRILVRGMGLSALDTILTFATGAFYRDKQGILRYDPGGSHAHILVASRSGYFPIVRGIPSTPPEL
ncbi:MAG: FAD/NAD(P)-binding protein, partial [Patescibacteria group bacterium]